MEPGAIYPAPELAPLGSRVSFDRDTWQEVTRRELLGTAWAGGMGGHFTNEMQVNDTAGPSLRHITNEAHRR